jgi:uncharacterized protein YbaR (Trm112 family)
MKFDTSLAARLACPACHCELRLENEEIICVNCGRAYPIIDGIPVLIAERTKRTPADNLNN